MKALKNQVTMKGIVLNENDKDEDDSNENNKAPMINFHEAT